MRRRRGRRNYKLGAVADVDARDKKDGEEKTAKAADEKKEVDDAEQEGKAIVTAKNKVQYHVFPFNCHQYNIIYVKTVSLRIYIALCIYISLCFIL